MGRERLGEFDLWKWDWKKVSLWIRDSFLVGRKSERKCRSQVSCERLSDRSLWKIKNVCPYWITRRSASVALCAICKSNDWRSLWPIAGKMGRLCVCWVVKISLVRIIFGQLRSVGWGLFDSLASKGIDHTLRFDLVIVSWLVLLESSFTINASIVPACYVRKSSGQWDENGVRERDRWRVLCSKLQIIGIVLLAMSLEVTGHFGSLLLTQWLDGCSNCW